MNKNVIKFPSTPLGYINSSYKNYLNALKSNFLVIAIYLVSYPSIYDPNLTNDCLPEPPTPISITLPRGYLSTRDILNI